MASFVAEFGGNRELVDKARAEALVQEVVESVGDGKPTKVRLSNKSFSQEAAVVVRDYLCTLTDVVVADISDIIAGRPTEEALSTLVHICSGLKDFPLVEVDVSDNALGPRGVESCRDVLNGKVLERLYLCNNGLSAESCEMVRDVLLADGCPALKLIHFYNNMSGNGGAEAVSAIVRAIAGTLQDFRYSATRAGNEGCEHIAAALGTCSGLTAVDLSDNSFGDDAAATLAESLKGQRGLQKLCLRDDALGDEGLISIINMLKVPDRFPELRFLDLSGCEIDEEKMEQLCLALLKLPKLSELLLDDNEFGMDGCTVLAGAVSALNSLKRLSCCSCEITAAGAVALAKSVSRLPSFDKLELNGNEICERGVQKVVSLLGRTGKHLGIMEDNDEEAEDDLDGDEDEEEEECEEEESNAAPATEDADLAAIESSMGAVKIEDSK